MVEVAIVWNAITDPSSDVVHFVLERTAWIEDEIPLRHLHLVAWLLVVRRRFGCLNKSGDKLGFFFFLPRFDFGRTVGHVFVVLTSAYAWLRTAFRGWSRMDKGRRIFVDDGQFNTGSRTSGEFVDSEPCREHHEWKQRGSSQQSPHECSRFWSSNQVLSRSHGYVANCHVTEQYVLVLLTSYNGPCGLECVDVFNTSKVLARSRFPLTEPRETEFQPHQLTPLDERGTSVSLKT